MENSLEQELEKLRKQKLNRTIKSYKNKSGENWYFFCLFYIVATGKLVELLDKIPESETTELDEYRSIIVPALYNFKHTLELVLKYIVISINNENQSTHNLELISSKINKSKLVKRIDWDKVESKLKEKGIKDWANIKDYVTQKIEDLNMLAENYLYQLHLNKYLKEDDFILIDECNELFKYPVTNSTRFQVDPISLYRIPKSAIQLIKNDYEKLRLAFTVIEDCFYISGIGS